MLRMQEMAFPCFKFQNFSGGVHPHAPDHCYPPLISNDKLSASSPGAIKKFHASHYMKGLHEVVCHIIGAQRGVGYERSG